MPGAETIFEDIHRLPGGNNLIFDLKTREISIGKFWDVGENGAAPNRNEDYFRKEILRLLEESVKKRLVSDVPLGAYLSGGIDSSAVVALLAKIKKERQDMEEIKTFSVAFEHGEHVNELPYANQVSELFGTKHREFMIRPDIVKVLPEIVWHLDEPLADPAVIPVYLLSENAKKHVTVVLTGDGGDEVFAGYDQYRFLMLADKLKRVPLSQKLPAIMKRSPDFLLNRFYKYASSMGKESYGKVEEMIRSLKSGNKAKAYYDLVSIFDDAERKGILGANFENIDYENINTEYFVNENSFLDQLLRFDLKNLLPECFLMKTDKMTMAHAIEARVPFLDYKLVEFSYSIPSSMKLRGATTKYILKKALQGILPQEILQRKKQTFHVPIENWLQKDMKGLVEHILDEREIRRTGLFDTGAVQKLFENYNKGKLFYARKMWNLICFMLWYDRFMR